MLHLLNMVSKNTISDRCRSVVLKSGESRWGIEHFTVLIIVQTRIQQLFEISPMLQFQCTLYQSSSMFALVPPLPNLYRTTLCLPFHAGTGTKLAGNWRQINNYWSWHQVGNFIVEAGIKLTVEEALHLLVQEPLQLLCDGSLLKCHWFKLFKLTLSYHFHLHLFHVHNHIADNDGGLPKWLWYW